jgi:hypothetical protein
LNGLTRSVFPQVCWFSQLACQATRLACKTGPQIHEVCQLACNGFPYACSLNEQAGSAFRLTRSPWPQTYCTPPHTCNALPHTCGSVLQVCSKALQVCSKALQVCEMSNLETIRVQKPDSAVLAMGGPLVVFLLARE